MEIKNRGYHMKKIICSFILIFFLISCDSINSPVSLENVQSESIESLNQASVTPPLIPGAIFERSWVNGYQWELVKPRPPGIGAGNDKVLHIYQIAPVFEDDPLSPGIEVPGFITLGGRDHVIDSQQVNGRNFRGIANTVTISYPDWAPAPPFGAAECAVPDLGPVAERIAWRWLEVSLHPCGQVPLVYAVDFDDDGCKKPLTTVERIESAVDGGFAAFDFPPEEPWPFAIRPLTKQGAGNVTVHPPSCI
jgi:hypothetical protein